MKDLLHFLRHIRIGLYKVYETQITPTIKWAIILSYIWISVYYKNIYLIVWLNDQILIFVCLSFPIELAPRLF